MLGASKVEMVLEIDMPRLVLRGPWAGVGPRQVIVFRGKQF